VEACPLAPWINEQRVDCSLVAGSRENEKNLMWTELSRLSAVCTTE